MTTHNSQVIIQLETSAAQQQVQLLGEKKELKKDNIEVKGKLELK